MKDPRYPFALDLGSEVGGYRIESVLGAGGFGITYRAFNEVTHKTVAIKEFYVRDISSRAGQTVIVDKDISEGTYEYALKKFQDEALAVVSRFAHPYIIRGENFIKANNTSYMIMEYVDGVSLEEWLTQRAAPPGEEEIRPFFEKLFTAIDYVHSQNTMHRDITPRNIMVRINGEPVLIDFGAAGHGIDRGRSSKMVAQMRYAPPEQTDESGPGVHGRYTDLFSLGGVLYRTVTGRLPVPPTTRLTRIARRSGDNSDPHVPTAEAVPDPTLFSEKFLLGVDKCLRLDEEERPQSIAELRSDLGWAPPFEGARPAPVPYEQPTMVITGEGTRLLAAQDRPPAPPAQPSSPLAPSQAVPYGATVAVHRPAYQATTTQPLGPVEAAVTAPTRETSGPPQGYRPQAPVPGPAEVAPPKAGGGRKWLVAGVAAVAIGAGGLAVAWPMLMRTMTEIGGPRTVSPFTMAANVDGRTIVLTGFAPSDAARAAIGEAAQRGAPDLRVDNRLEVANGAPPAFSERAAFAAGRLGRLARGSVKIEGDQVALEGTAASPEAWQALEQDLAATLPGGGRVDAQVRPAAVAPYVFQAQTGRDGVSLTGYVPNGEARARLRSAAERAVPGTALRDDSRIADGEPAGFADTVAFLLPRLADLGEGRILLSGQTVTIEGRARNAEAYERASTLDPATVPGSPRVSVNVVPPAVSPFEWSATYDGQSVVLRGYSPSREVRRDLIAAANQALPGVGARDETQIADGAPPDFARAARFALDVVPKLARGRIAISGDAITIEGAARNPADFATLTRTPGTALPPNFRVTQNAVNAPRISPYPFTVSVGSGLVRLTGFVPSDAARKDIAAAVQASLPGVKVTDETQIADGAAEGFVAAVRFGLGQAGRLAAGRVSFDDGAIAIDGTVKTIDDLKPLKDAARAALPRGFSVSRVTIGSRADVPAQDCDRLALPNDHPDRPQGEAGVELAQVDAARAVPACQSATQTYPNVRRFFTALGFALQKRGQSADAVREYRRAAEADDPVALSLLAGAYREGLGAPQDLGQAFDLYNRAAALGNASATHAIGWMFENGLGRPVDPVKAAEWYQKAAALGSAESYAQLGWLAQNGLGRKVDYARAADSYERGAKLGSTLAMHQLGFMNQNGLGRPVDLAKAYEWYERAARLGRAESMTVLGTFHLEGVGRPIDYDKAVDWFEKAAAAGSSAAMYQLGAINLEGLGRRRDPAAAISWFERSAALGRTDSMFRLGLVYQNGTGVPQDYAKAFEWYQKGARANDPRSIHQIGWLYENGLGRPVDYARAFDWYNRAAGLGYAPSMHQIGWHYETGRGRPVDYARAAEWYQRAADLGDGNALNQLGWLAENGFGRPRNDAEAAGWYERAAAAGSTAAMWNAALLFDAGRGVQADGEKAATLLLNGFARREANSVDALSGDMSAFSEETRKGVQRILQRRGLYRGQVDGVYSAETRRAVLSYPGTLTN
ncbi:protein kinase domain-containing protein [Prosthecomicrobium sp. N25]|uniref:protein kinase domain-containing protein n=1 Tax=Prosthecomicrobium sp. N25 TaxID=3129254 RepID=UPI003077EC21